ncbi:hypothetical protein [Flavobacterium sp. W22_SRS_FP1]|uniref:hypothetical protein n=1 Tax=Flavobacterium sp. W22_SRS_FP1 TaxID=3240276 RepID=UPI003F935460
MINSEFSIKFITAVLNSKLTTYFFSKFLSTDTLQGSYSSIYPEDLRQIPIKENKDFENKIVIKVNEILYLKSQDPKADTQALEQEIDTMVYELYGLSDEEIKIVEGN